MSAGKQPTTDLALIAVFAALIAIDALAHKAFKLNAVLAFWIAYILTRPLGASIGDYLSQPADAGGLELGTVATSVIFLVAISLTVIYLAVTKKDAKPIEVDSTTTSTAS